MIITRTSTISGITRKRDIPLDPNDWAMWKMGMGSIDDVMPYLSDADRDFILSGITSTEWAEAFLNEEESV